MKLATFFKVSFGIMPILLIVTSGVAFVAFSMVVSVLLVARHNGLI